MQQVYSFSGGQVNPTEQTVRSDTLTAASNSRVQVQAVIALAQRVHTGLTMLDHRQLTTDTALRSTFKCVYFRRQSREARGAGRTTRVYRVVPCSVCVQCSC